MMEFKTYEAIYDTQEIVRNLLIQAGFIDGLSLSPEQIKSATQTIFWYINTKSKDASDKETYITYSINDVEPFQYADGEVTVRKASVVIEIFTRKRFIKDVIKIINETMLNNEWTFELQSMNYDNGSQMYVHVFSCEALIMSDE